MRYLDWDILLFPAVEEGANVPVREFQTRCLAERNDGPPLLHTFVPSLLPGTPFQVSVHSWSKTAPRLAVAPNATPPRELWQVKVVVDGVCLCAEELPVDAAWPQVLSTTTPSTTHAPEDALRFPPFDRNVMFQQYWDASDQLGRIRVELAWGYAHLKDGNFRPITKVVNFAFQPAPIEVLEAKGIAWPNPYIGLAHHGGRLSHPVGFANRHGPVTHSDVAHMNDACHPPGAVPRPAYQPVDSPLQAYNQAAAAKHDGDGSRSSSQYSVVPDSARPLFSRDLFTQTYPAHAVDPARKAGQMAVRLPSDQLQMLLHAINPVHQQPGTISAVQMPPPPLPAHAISARQDGASHQRFGSSGAVERPPLADTVHVVDRRGDSRYSDVSMHAGCTSFPTCTTIDSDGHVEHTAAAPPATMVKGKKEGSASTKPRDFFSTILDTTADPPMTELAATPTSKQTGVLVLSSPADTHSKKRTRSALGALNINDGSPEKREAYRPPQKASRAPSGTSQAKKKLVVDSEADQENMVLDF